PLNNRAAVSENTPAASRISSATALRVVAADAFKGGVIATGTKPYFAPGVRSPGPPTPPATDHRIWARTDISRNTKRGGCEGTHPAPKALRALVGLSSSCGTIEKGLCVGLVLDAVVGDPRRGHPVAAFGRAASALERRLYADSRARGAVFAATCVLGAA